MASGVTSVVNAALSVTGGHPIHATAERSAAMAQSRTSPEMTRGAGLCIVRFILTLPTHTSPVDTPYGKHKP